MIRPLAALAVLALGLNVAIAQEAAPVAPAAPEVVVDPMATLNASPKQANMLTGFYATQAVIELCTITLEPAILEGMTADRLRLENALGMDAAAGTKAYDMVKADVAKTSPDCADGSADRQSVDAVTAIYAAASAPAAPTAPIAGTVTAAPPAQ